MAEREAIPWQLLSLPATSPSTDLPTSLSVSKTHKNICHFQLTSHVILQFPMPWHASSFGMVHSLLPFQHPHTHVLYNGLSNACIGQQNHSTVNYTYNIVAYLPAIVVFFSVLHALIYRHVNVSHVLRWLAMQRLSMVEMSCHYTATIGFISA